MPENSAILTTISIVCGAVPGALSRYYLTEWCKKAIGNNFPYGTFIINITGCFLMGFFFTLFKGIPRFPPEIDLLVRTGFLGSYTTFSTYGYDTLILWQNKKGFAVGFYWAGSAILGLISVQVGVLLAKLFVG